MLRSRGGPLRHLAPSVLGSGTTAVAQTLPFKCCWKKRGKRAGCRRQLPVVHCSPSPGMGGATTGSTVKMPNNSGQEIRWGCALSRATSLPVAIREAVNKVLKSIGGPEAQPELAIVFVSSIHGADFEQVIPILRELVPSLKHVFGCSGYGIVGGGPDGPVEVEGEPGFSLTLGSIPGADIQVLHTLRSSIPAADATPEEWADFVGVPHDTQRPVSFLTFADPRFAQVRDMVGGLDYAFPNSPKIGAILASGTRSRSRAMFAWSATPRKQRRQLGERLEGSSNFSSGRDYYLRQARAEAKSAALKPRPSLPIATLTEEQGEDGPATAALQAQQKERAQQAGVDNTQAGTDNVDNNGSGTSSSSSPTSSTGSSENAGSSSRSGSISQSNEGKDEGVSVASEDGGVSSQGETSGKEPLAPPIEANISKTSSSSKLSSTSTQQQQEEEQQQQQQQQSEGKERMKVGRGVGGAGVLGDLFNRFVKGPLGGLGQARQQQQQQQRSAQSRESRESGSSREGVSSSGSRQESEVSEGSSVSAPSASASAAAAAVPDSGRVSSGSATSTSSSSSNDVSGGGVGTAQSSDVSSSNRASSNGGPSSSDRMVSTFKSFFGRSPLPIGQAGRAGTEDEDAGESNQGGVYMYGAILLALHGDVVLDTVTSMGYRAPSPCIWRIEGVTSKNEIVSIVPEALVENGSEGAGGKGSFLGRGGQSSNPRSSLLEDSSDEEDEEELSAIFESTKPEVQAITAVVDMLDGLGEDSVDSWNELVDGAAVAIASDSSKRTSELGPDDWELLPLVDILEEYGVLKVGGSPVLGGGCDLRPGHRLRLMVRDTQGIKDGMTDSMLRYKRNNLGAMMSGSELPPTFGTLLLTDVDRGFECYQTPHFESHTAHAYVPAPLAGIFGGAQIGPLKSGPGGGNGATGILENSAVLGVLRAATDKSPAAVKRQADAKAQVVKQQQQQQRDAAASGDSSSSGGGGSSSVSSNASPSRDRSSGSKDEQDGTGKESDSRISEGSKQDDAGEGGPGKRAD